VRKLILPISAIGLAAGPSLAAGEPGTDAGRRELVPERVLDRAAPDLDRRVAERRGERRRAKRREARERSSHAASATAKAALPPQLEAIARCESGGNPSAVGGGGQFRGKYQFTYATWAAVGGSGDPAAAPEAEQDRRAAILYARSGPGQWPVCGQ
jgi:hypothetical protein